MKCHTCGGEMERILTDLPFKLTQHSIAILKHLPVLQCQNCNEFMIEDPVMEKVDTLLEKIDSTVEVEILNYAA